MLFQSLPLCQFLPLTYFSRLIVGLLTMCCWHAGPNELILKNKIKKKLTENWQRKATSNALWMNHIIILPFYFHPSQFFISPLCFCWTLLAIISSFAVLLLLFFHPCLDLSVVLFSLDCFVMGQHSDREKKRKTQLTSIKENWKPRQSLIVR